MYAGKSKEAVEYVDDPFPVQLVVPSLLYPPQGHIQILDVLHAGLGLQGHRVGILELSCTDKCKDAFGLHHGTVRAACVVITMKNGVVIPASTKEGCIDAQVEIARRRPYDSILLAGEYWFIPDDFDKAKLYKIYKGLGEWKLDMNLIPKEWIDYFELQKSNHSRDVYRLCIEASDMPAAIRERDNSCRVTFDVDATDVTQFVPESEVKWYFENLQPYNDNFRLFPEVNTNDIRNGILLRADLCSAFNNLTWTPVVKFKRLVCHYMKPTFGQGIQFHNHAIAEIENASVCHHWCRFALAIFAKVPTTCIVDMDDIMNALTLNDGVSSKKDLGGTVIREGRMVSL